MVFAQLEFIRRTGTIRKTGPAKTGTISKIGATRIITHANLSYYGKGLAGPLKEGQLLMAAITRESIVTPEGIMRVGTDGPRGLELDRPRPSHSINPDVHGSCAPIMNLFDAPSSNSNCNTPILDRTFP